MPRTHRETRIENDIAVVNDAACLALKAYIDGRSDTKEDVITAMAAHQKAYDAAQEVVDYWEERRNQQNNILQSLFRKLAAFERAEKANAELDAL